MAFKPINLSVLAYANNFTLWHYISDVDDISDMISGGYFNRAEDQLRINDLIVINAADTNTSFWVVGNDGGNVEVAEHG